MIALQIARLIANFDIFLNFTDDDSLDPDAAVKAMKVLGANLQALDKAFLRDLVDAFAVIAPEYSEEVRAEVRKIPHGYYLEETLAEGNPVRLAELEALREQEE